MFQLSCTRLSMQCIGAMGGLSKGGNNTRVMFSSHARARCLHPRPPAAGRKRGVRCCRAWCRWWLPSHTCAYQVAASCSTPIAFALRRLVAHCTVLTPPPPLGWRDASITTQLIHTAHSTCAHHSPWHLTRMVCGGLLPWYTERWCEHPCNYKFDTPYSGKYTLVLKFSENVAHHKKKDRVFR